MKKLEHREVFTTCRGHKYKGVDRNPIWVKPAGEGADWPYNAPVCKYDSCEIPGLWPVSVCIVARLCSLCFTEMECSKKESLF